MPKEPRRIRAWIQALNDPQQGRAARQALLKAGSRAVVPLLVALSDPRLRTPVVEVLGEIGDERVIAPLLPFIHDKERDVRLRAIEALGLIAFRLSESGDISLLLLIQPIRDSLEPLLEDKDWRIRLKTVCALFNTRCKFYPSDWIERLADKNDHVKATVLWHLARFFHENDAQVCSVYAELFLPRLLPLLKNRSEAVRTLTAFTLAGMMDAQAVKPLIPLLQDESGEVREIAAYALGCIGDARALLPLSQLLPAGELSLRCTAIWALGKLGNERAIDFLVPLLQDREGAIREMAGLALRDIGNLIDRKLDLN